MWIAWLGIGAVIGYIVAALMFASSLESRRREREERGMDEGDA